MKMLPSWGRMSYTVVMLLYGHVIDDVRERHNYK